MYASQAWLHQRGGELDYLDEAATAAALVKARKAM